MAGLKGSELLLAAIKGNGTAPAVTLIEPSLQSRESTRLHGREYSVALPSPI
jgi:hypothetical protein